MSKLIYTACVAVVCGSLFVSCGKQSEEDKATIVTPQKSPDQFTYTLSVLTGSSKGYQDGKLTDAKFNNPFALTIDAQDNLYVADRGNYTVRMIKPDGTVSTLTNSLGKKLETSYQLEAMKLDNKGNLYLIEYNTIAKITPSGEKTTLCGITTGNETYGYKDDKGNKARFNRPSGLVINADNSLYVTDLNNKVIRKVEADGTVSTYCGNPQAQTIKDGDLQSATFNSPSGLSVDSKGNLYVSEYFRNVIRKIAVDGKVTTIAGNSVSGYGDAEGTKAMFNAPKGIYTTKDGYTFVADVVNNSIRLVSPNGIVTTLYKGQLSAGGINDITDVAVDSKGNVYFVVPEKNSIVKLSAN